MGDADRLRTLLVERAGTALAVAEAGSGAVLLENQLFREWFPGNGSPIAALPGRVPGLDLKKAGKRLERGRPYRLETEVQAESRARAVRVELRAAEDARGELLLVEAHDISRQKEAEYMLDSYSKLTEKHTRELEREKARVERLLLNVMPRSVYDELKDFGTTTPRTFESASVLMLDFVGFTDMALTREASALIAELNDIFTAFDRIVEHFGCERIKTVGDAYMAVAGIPEPVADHAVVLARVALRMRRYLEKRNASAPNQWLCRMGIASGPVIGSIVGVKKYVYDVFGPTVNLAARLEAAAEAMEIAVCPETWERLQDEFVLGPARRVELKGLGCREVRLLEGEVRARA